MMRTTILLLAFPTALAAQQTAIAKITVTPASPRVVAGDTLRLKAQAIDANGRPVPGVTIRFQQAGGSFEGLIDETGLITGGSPSRIPVVVAALTQAGGAPVLEQVVVEVVPGPAAKILIDPRPAKLMAGQSFRVVADVQSAAGDTRHDRVTWTSSAAAIARVANDGTITALAPGRATITAAVGAVRGTLTVEVVAANVSSIALTPSSPEAKTGDVIRFTLSAKDAAGQDIAGLSPTWLFAPGRGEIGPDGRFVGYEAGTYTVSASLGARSAQTTVTLTARDVRRPATVLGSVVRSAFPTSEVWLHPTQDIAYLGTHLGGDRVYVLDVGNSEEPKIIDSVTVNARVINDVMTDEQGKVLVITREGADDRKNGIVIASLENPRKPRIVGEFTQGVTAGVHSAYVYTQPRFGTHVYLTNDATGALHIVDITNPAQPREVAQWKTPRADAGRTLHDIDVRDGMVYASYWNDGLVILDVGKGIKGGSPSNPQLVSQYKYDLNAMYKQVEAVDGPGFIRGTHTAWRHKNYVFIADEVFTNADIQALMTKQASRAYGRLQVIDVSDVLNPRSVAFYEPEYGGVHNIWVAGDTLYMGAYNAGFRAFDVSGELRGDLRAQQREIAHVNPVSPNGFIPNFAMTWGVVVKNGIAYVNDFNSGLYIVKLGGKPVVMQ
jgi:hypothetical protein